MRRATYVLVGVTAGLALSYFTLARPSGNDPDGQASVEPETRPVVEVDGLSVYSPWVRPAAPTAGESAPVNSGAYLTISSSREDRLVGAESGVAASTEIHETRREGEMARMGPADPASLSVGPGRPLELRPGGLHIMLLSLNSPLTEGDTVWIDLIFESGTRVAVPALVGRR
jgi:copper(I)-binding protein